ncbi:MAG TPA: hypothetical protein VJ911_08860 [Cryomorphaceae bacterium]|nr:hypothetical protein [Cryomorphaceae bacterium]
MGKKKILIVSRTFYPVASPRSFRTTELAKEFARMGHQVTVVLPENMESSIARKFENKLGIQFLYYGPLKWKPFRKSKLFGDFSRKFGRLLFLLFEYPNIEIFFKLPSFLGRLKGYDLLISIAVPHENHWAIAKVRTNEHPIAKTWIADCGDPFIGNVLERISPPFYFQKLENSFLRKADVVAVPTEKSIEAYNEDYHHKFEVIPQGFKFEDVELEEYNPKKRTPTFAYAGGVTSQGVRSLNSLIRVLKSQDKDFVFHIYSSNAKEVLKNEVSLEDHKFVLHEAIPRLQLLRKLSTMDFLINLDNGTSRNTPSKLIDYGLCKRPILNVNPINPEKEIIESFLKGDYKERLIIEDLDKYNISKVVEQFLKCAERGKLEAV